MRVKSVRLKSVPARKRTQKIVRKTKARIRLVRKIRTKIILKNKITVTMILAAVIRYQSLLIIMLNAKINTVFASIGIKRATVRKNLPNGCISIAPWFAKNASSLKN